MRRMLAERVARNSGWMIAVLAILGLVFAVWVILAGPILLPPDIQDRSSVSGAIGGLFALVAAIVAVSAGAWISSSDYKAAQEVKADTARLRAALRSILVKGVQLEQDRHKAHKTTFDKEREVINLFMTSTTAFGFWSWADQRSIQAGHASEQWRALFIHLARLVDASESHKDHDVMLSSAVRLEELLATLSRNDVDVISSYVSNLAESLGGATGDVILGSIASRYREPIDIKWKFQHLELKGISSPNVELYLGIFNNDEDRLQRALAAGADPSLSDLDVLGAYGSQLADFDASDWQ